MSGHRMKTMRASPVGMGGGLPQMERRLDLPAEQEDLVERPEGGVLRQRVDEAVALGQEARRHEWPQDEADEREPGRDGERVPPEGPVVAPPAEQEDPDARRHDEVQRSVEVVAGDDERREVQGPLLEDLLVVDAEDLLDADA